MVTSFDIYEVHRISNSANYFLIALLFIFLIAFSIFVILFAKWLTMGPKIKNLWFKFIKKININQKKENVTLKKGRVFANEEYLDKINKKIDSAQTPQELLKLKALKDNYEKSKLKAQEKIKSDEQLKLKKIEDKKEKVKIKKEFKEEAKKIKNDRKRRIK